ncbi:MAG: nucleotidyltransferase family protein [Marinilabilia sp.]
MNAMIFAAGLGSRLRPLTSHKPKALIEVAGMPLLEIALRKMENAGITKVVVNVHHHREQMLRFIESYRSPGMEIIISDEKDQLLDTGGGLLKARPLFDAGNPVLLYNVDIVTTAMLTSVMRFHNQEAPLASLMVKERPTSRHLLFDEQMQLAGWENTQNGEEIIVRNVDPLRPMGFQGIHVINPAFFDLIEETGVFPIMKPYLRLARTHVIKGYETRNDEWFDIGTPEKLKSAEEYIKTHPNETRQIWT